MRIYAHRGFSHKYPEGSRQAYEGAIEAGADGFECDLRLSKENVLVCFHDRTTFRIAGVRKFVSRQSVPKLRSIANVMTFDELLTLAITHRKDILAETKHPVLRRGKVERELIRTLATRASEIKSSGIQVTAMSFSYLAVRRLKKSYPNVVKVIKYTASALMNRNKCVAVNIEILRKHPGLLKWMRADVMYVWTVNSKEDLRWIKKKDVDGVITDRVIRAEKILRS
ncbi:MAG: glycerophosphodiester phosphodiesterase [Actinomycetota bacterium]